MSVSAVSSTSSGTNSAVNSDVEVQQLKHQIQDWSTCPTTPAATKKVIVAKLQAQLDSVEQSIEAGQKLKQSEQPSGPTGVGGNVDISV